MIYTLHLFPTQDASLLAGTGTPYQYHEVPGYLWYLGTGTWTRLQDS